MNNGSANGSTNGAAIPYRQVHLDFHTGPNIPDVGKEFDARAFARTMKAAHVNSVTVFAKCHHGHLYYNTRRPERHPGLRKGLDLLGEQIDALHREGIRAPIYISVQCDEYAANTHPEWVARNPDGSQVKWADGVFAPGWQIMDMSSPYQEFLAEQIRDVLRLFRPVDGIFFDMCWDQLSCTKWAIDGMQKSGLDPTDESDRRRYARQVAIAYMKRFYRMVRAASKHASVYFNGRPYFNLTEDIAYYTQVEIEALPTGGWGYLYFPKNVRFARTFSKPYVGQTARFHKSWADFGGLKPYAALEYETSQMMAHGARCSIGDQLHPRGVLDKAAYELIGAVYKRVADRQPWLTDARPLSQIGVFQLPAGPLTNGSTSQSEEGVTRMLTQLKHQFDMVDGASRLEDYELLILPDTIWVDQELARRLGSFVDNGGALLATGTSGLNRAGTELLLPALPIRPGGLSAYQTAYLRFGRQISRDVPPTDHVMYERAVNVLPAPGAQALAKVVEPYFDRAWNHFSSHQQTPPNKPGRFAAAVLRGRVAYIAYPIFSAFAAHGNYPYRLLVRNILERLLPEPLLRLEAPTGTEATVMRQQNARRTIVHLLQYAPERRASGLDLVEDIVPLHNVPLSLKLANEPGKVYLAPQQMPLDFQYAAGRVNVRVPEVAGHAMVVFE